MLGADVSPIGKVTGVDDAPTTEPAPDRDSSSSPDADRGAAPRAKGVEAAKIHLTLLVALALCAVAFRFELGRALGGNGLSWAYVFEWPLFAIFAVYMWWSVLHGGRTHTRRTRPDRPAGPAVDPRYAGMLEAWQAHQRDLQASQAEAEGRDPPGDAPPPR